MNKKSVEIIKKIAISRNWNKATTTSYKNAINNYCNFQNETLDKLIKESQNEEDKENWKKTKLRQRLVDYRIYLYERYNISTAKLYLTRVMTFYRSFDITVLDLPYISEKGVKKTPPISFRDLPDKEIIKKAINISQHDFKAIILFISSSGCARAETLNLTIKDFILGCSEYHTIDISNPKDEETKIKEFIDEMIIQKNIVPSFKIRRQKTDKFYYTFCSPEASEAILTYLLIRQDTLKYDKKLFKLNESYFFKKFSEINKILDLGKISGKNRFRSHMLRKFHASRLAKSEFNEQTGKNEPGMNINNIDALQGRGKSGTRNSYFFDDFESLKAEYIQNLNKLTIFPNNDFKDNNLHIEENIQSIEEKGRQNQLILDIQKKLIELEELFNLLK